MIDMPLAITAPRFPVGDCRVGDCLRPVDHGGEHGEPTARERATLAARCVATPAPADPFDSDEWRALEAAAAQTSDYVCPATGLTAAEIAALPDATPAPAPARSVAPAGLRAGTRRVAGGVDGRPFAYVGVIRDSAGRVAAECGHEHANRDWPTGGVLGSAKDCARSILTGATDPVAAERHARTLRTAAARLRPAAGFQHPAGTVEAARAAAEANAAAYLEAVAAVRAHLPAAGPA